MTHLKRGRKPIEINIQEVEHLAGLGLTLEEISDCLGISYSTLNRRLKDLEVVEAAIKRGEICNKAHYSRPFLCAEGLL
jgi:DNA-binding CsgD family transcriptional regulator